MVRIPRFGIEVVESEDEEFQVIYYVLKIYYFVQCSGFVGYDLVYFVKS